MSVEHQDLPGAFSLFTLLFIALSTLQTLDHSKLPCPVYDTLFCVISASTLGLLWEARGGPVSLLPLVSGLRMGISSMTTPLLFRFALSLSSTFSNSIHMKFVASFLSSFTLLYAYLGHDRWRLRLLLPILHVSTVFVIIFLPSDIHNAFTRVFLILSVFFIALGPFIASKLPVTLKSFVLHVVFTICATCIYITCITSQDRNKTTMTGMSCSSFSNLSVTSIVFGILVNIISDIPTFIGTVTGLYIAATISRKNRNELRYDVTFPFWFLLHRFLLSRSGPLPEPPRRSNTSSLIPFMAYGQKHLHASPLSVPSAQTVPESQQFRNDLLHTIFSLTDWMDVNMPACDPFEHPRDKPRVDPRLGLSYFWRASLIDFETPSTPNAMQRAFREGNLMGYVLQHSHGWRSVRVPTKQERELVSGCNLVLDYDWLSHYEARDGYAPYGGCAFLQATAEKNESEKKDDINDIKVLSLKCGNSLLHNNRSANDEKDASVPGRDHFLHAQRCVHASSIFVEVVLHHLLEIHTVTSLISVALHNSFDVVSGAKAHGFRSVMQLHFYASAQVQEVTTPHLLNRYATFPQVFALRPHAVSAAIDDHYFRDGADIFLADVDIQRRGDIAKTAQFRDEVRYFKIFEEYASTVVRAIWIEKEADMEWGLLSKDEQKEIDKALKTDNRMKIFLKEIANRLPSGKLPKRFVEKSKDDDDDEQDWSAKGLVNFISEILHLVTVRHEVLGTKMALSSVDFRYSGLGAHVSDGGAPAKEDYSALLLITAATALKPFPLLLSDETRKSVKKCHERYLGTYDKCARALVLAFDEMVNHLVTLKEEWEKDGDDRNRDLLRIMPDELNLMAGY